MDKKKVGELDGTPIVTGKKNYANEHEYYLTMNEDNTYQKLELRVSGDKFRLVLGGGSNNYPTPTAGDVNKVWQVTPVQKGVNTEEIVIVSEQTLEDGQELEYNDKFVPGAQCVAVIDDIEYRGEVVENKGNYFFTAEFGSFQYVTGMETFSFLSEGPIEVTAKLSIIEKTPIYDYNWAPGVKIPIPTAEDEGKILVVTKVAGDDASIIVPEQEVPADTSTPLTDVDLKYFVPGNTVTATVTIQQEPDDEEKKGGDALLKGAESSNSQTMIVSGIIEQKGDIAGVVFNEGQEDEFQIAKVPYGEPVTPPTPGEGVIKSINTKSSSDTEYILVTNLYEIFGGDIEPFRGNTIPYATIKLEYGEPNYEYLLQENSGSSSGSDSGGSGGGGSTGGASGVVIQDGSIVNNASSRPATEADVAKFSGDSVGVGSPVIEINGIVPYVLQVSPVEGSAMVYLLTNLNLTEHSVFYAYSGVGSPNVSAEFRTIGFVISDDVTLLSPTSVG